MLWTLAYCTTPDVPASFDRIQRMIYCATPHRIDQSHSNAYAEWVRQGKPMYPAPAQRAAIEARASL
jgi:hypothetical protein